MNLTPLSPDEQVRYSRQIMLPEIGETGQLKLKQASALIIGAGGLGSAASLYLAAAGVGRIGLADADAVELANLQRQILHDTPHIARSKAVSGRDRLLALNPEISVNAIPSRLEMGTAQTIAEGYGIILDCSDNFDTRYLINSLCVTTCRPEVHGSVYRFEGQVAVFDARSGPCYRCLYPAPLQVMSQVESTGGIFTPVPGIIGTLMAVETLKLILGTGTPLYGQLLAYNALESSFQKITFRKKPDCPVCGNIESHQSQKNFHPPGLSYRSLQE
jgi:adenylyltransferase/sulfurtransferase